MLNIIPVGIGMIFLIFSIFFFWRTFNISRVKASNLFWLTNALLMFFFLVGYASFGFFLITGKEFIDPKLLVSQIFFWGSVFVLFCTRLFYITTLEKNRLLEQSKMIGEELRKSEEKYRSLIESTDDSIYMVDRNCNYLFINPKHMERLGVKEYQGLGYGDCHSYEEMLGFARSVSSVFESGMPEHNEYGSEGKWYLRTLSPVKDPDTGAVKAAAVTVVSTDITSRKNEEEIRIENERLASASKAKSEFLANMSHELRTPLNSIIGFSELMKQKTVGELNRKQERFVDNVLTSSKFLLNLIDDILDLSKVEAGKIELVVEQFSVSDIIGETLNLLKEKAAKHNIILQEEIDPQLDIIEADKQRVKQILFNLLSNALKFSKKEGGLVTIIVKKEIDWVSFRVTDTGIGIREEDIGKLFKEFEQLEKGPSRKYGGTGLGLAISKRLVELHGGKIWAESIYGDGAAFTFLLPIKTKCKLYRESF